MLSLFPCLVTLPDRSVLQTCRVVSDQAGTTVWWWDPAAGTAIAAAVSPFGIEERSPGSKNYTLGMPEGDPIHVRRLSSCGCGHPMKRWRPPRVPV